MRVSLPLGAGRHAVAVASFLAAVVSTSLAWGLGAAEQAEPSMAQTEPEPLRPVWRIQTDDGVIELTNQWGLAGDVDPIELPNDAELASDWRQADAASLPKSEPPAPKVAVENQPSAHSLPIALALALGWIAFVMLWMRRRHRLRGAFQTPAANARDQVSTPVEVVGPWFRRTPVEPDRVSTPVEVAGPWFRRTPVEPDRVSTPVEVAGPWLRRTPAEPLSPKWVSQIPRGKRVLKSGATHPSQATAVAAPRDVDAVPASRIVQSR